MKGSFKRTGCTCEKRCRCGATWEYVIDVGINPATGKRKQVRRKGFLTEREARDNAMKVFLEKTSGIYIENSKTTFLEFSERLINDIRLSGDNRESTLRMKRYHVDLLKDYIGFIDLQSLTRVILQNSINTLSVKFNQSTVYGIITTIKFILKKAIMYNLINSNPSQYLFVPKSIAKKSTKDKVYLEKDELQKLLSFAKENAPNQDYLIIKTLSYTGIRAGELSGLRWIDLDDNNCMLSVRRTVHSRNGMKAAVVNEPKTSDSARTISIDPALMKELMAHKKAQLADRLASPIKNWNADGYVFVRDEGLPLIPQIIYNLTGRVSRGAGLCRVNPHMLRHTHTSICAEAGISLEVISSRLGHKNDKVTKEIYLHVTPKLDKDTSTRFSAHLGNL